MGEVMHVCGYERCGRSFTAPVRLTDLSHRPRSETYFACPYCFSKVDASEEADHRLFHSSGFEMSTPEDDKNLKTVDHKKSLKAEASGSCPHGLGYLKTRSKDQAIPDGCLTCPRILQCMA